MTIELSLRNRARRARYMAAVWLIVVTVILIGTYISLPIIANRTAVTFQRIASQPTYLEGKPQQESQKASPFNVEFYSIGVLALSLLAICFASFLLGRAAFVEIELAARFIAFADALCIAGDDFKKLETATNLFLPGTKYLSVPEIFSTRDLSSVVNVLKDLRGK